MYKQISFCCQLFGVTILGITNPILSLEYRFFVDFLVTVFEDYILKYNDTK